MESVLRGHPERTVPFVVKSWRVLDLSQTLEDGSPTVLYQERDNHMARREILLTHASSKAHSTDILGIQILEIHGDEHVHGAIFEVRVYET